MMRVYGTVVLLLGATAATAASPYEVRESAATSRETLLAADAHAWAAAQKIVWGPEKYSTQFRALWSDAGLFIRFDATDPAPWYTKEQNDVDLWREEVVEIFLDADLDGDDYIEINVNPGNVVCDVHVDASAARFDASWDFDGLQSRVELQRDAIGRTNGWTATVFLPWSGMNAARSAPGKAPPQLGQLWRFNVFRIERPHGPADPERNALFLAWSPTGKRSFHAPEAFREFVLR